MFLIAILSHFKTFLMPLFEIYGIIPKTLCVALCIKYYVIHKLIENY